LELEPEKWHVIKMPAYDAELDAMLAPDILDRETYEDRKGKTDPSIFEGNYQQAPRDGEDRLYPGFKTYQPDTLPQGGTVEAYFDTADEGSDYLAGAVYKVHRNTAYVLELLYSQEAMEKTEGQSASMLADWKATKAMIESNNGGKGFARNVEQIMRERIGYTGCNVQWFHQSENKQARILSQATSVCNSVVMPDGWEKKWPEFARDVLHLSRMSKWTHDDAPDLLTGIVEKSLSPEIVRVYPAYIDDKAICEDITPDPLETIYVGQLLDQGFVRPTPCVERQGIICALRTFDIDQALDAPRIIREAYPQNTIVWYVDISDKEAFPAYRQAMQDANIQLWAGTVYPSPIEMPSIINRLLKAGRLRICQNADRLRSVMASRIIDRDGKPETGDGATAPQYICGGLEYLAYRLTSSRPDAFGM
jgi:predicted phage terminase large subunit-like protein